MKEKYNCPSIAKQDLPLWKISVIEFKKVIKIGLYMVHTINNGKYKFIII